MYKLIINEVSNLIEANMSKSRDEEEEDYDGVRNQKNQGLLSVTLQNFIRTFFLMKQ